MRYLSRSVSATSKPLIAFHADVQQRQIGPVLARQQDGVVAVVGVDHVVAGLGRAVHQRGQHQPVVVHHEDRARLAVALTDVSLPDPPRGLSAQFAMPPHAPDAGSSRVMLGRSSRTLVCTCPPCCAMASAALRRGSSAQAQPETPPGTRAG